MSSGKFMPIIKNSFRKKIHTHNGCTFLKIQGWKPLWVWHKCVLGPPRFKHPWLGILTCRYNKIQHFSYFQTLINLWIWIILVLFVEVPDHGISDIKLRPTSGVSDTQKWYLSESLGSSLHTPFHVESHWYVYLLLLNIWMH